MGCVCGKPSATVDARKERSSNKVASNERLATCSSSRAAKPHPGIGDGRVVVFQKQANGSIRLEPDKLERRSDRQPHALGVIPHPAAAAPPKAVEAEHVAAGWPAWLAVVASEAIRGWVPRRADSFEKLDKVITNKK